MADTRPERIGRYEVLAELGQGAMGIVYKARDPQLARLVAIKTLRRDLGLPPEEYVDFEKRFYQEATAAGRLNHPNIVTIYDVIEIGDVPYIVMELLEGQTLAEVIAAKGPLAPAEAVRLIVQVCGALEYAHTHGVVHRDIKPGNIIVGPGDVAKVSDFGIARLAGSNLTRTGVVVGTPAYMSPEQLRGRVPDARSDLFSLGVVLYEALSGVNPFKGEDVTATLYRLGQVDPVHVSERNRAVPLALDRATARVIAKDPDQRYQTAHSLAQALTDAVDRSAGSGSVTAAPAATPPRPARRAPPLRAAVVVAACLLLGGVGWGLWQRAPSCSALGLTGCERGTKQDIVNRAQLARTRGELEQVLGKPDRFEGGGVGPLRIETWIYKASDGEVVFLITGDKVALKRTTN
jgi:serine/threonine protein kinase